MRSLSLGMTLAAALALLPAGTGRAGSMICFEAESATALTPPMVMVDAAKPAADAKLAPHAGASGDKYLTIPKGAGKPPDVGGDATYTFETTEAGTYFLWGRAWWIDACSSSFTMSIDGFPGFTFGKDGTFKTWHWVRSPLRLKQLELTAGKHTLKISNRQDGPALDQIVLCKEPRYVPVDIETVTPGK